MSTEFKSSDKLKRNGWLMAVLIIFFMLNNLALKAQQRINNPRTAEINIIARVDTDSVVLRWAPSKAGGG